MVSQDSENQSFLLFFVVLGAYLALACLRSNMMSRKAYNSIRHHSHIEMFHEESVLTLIHKILIENLPQFD